MFKPPRDEPLPDLRDEIEKAEVTRILSALPPDHPAHAANAAGKDTISMTHLVADRKELIEALIAVYFARVERVWKTSAHFRPETGPLQG